MEIPTAEEILLKHFEETFGHKGHGDFMPYIQKSMIEFAELHVKATIEAVKNSIKTKEDIAIFVEGIFKTIIVDKDSILNAYPLTNIK